jgi:hypothetical protein
MAPVSKDNHPVTIHEQFPETGMPVIFTQQFEPAFDRGIPDAKGSCAKAANAADCVSYFPVQAMQLVLLI